MYRIPDIKSPHDFSDDFTTSPDGLLALGGNIHPLTLVYAYVKGIFPWYSRGDPILWWHPDPRMVLFPQKIYISKRFRKLLHKVYVVKKLTAKNFSKSCLHQVTFNTVFPKVMEECRLKRGKDRTDTWIQPEFLQSYTELFHHGFAQSVEVWDGNKKLVGGLYGVTIGKIFFGESMFSHVPDASKIAMVCLCERLAATGYLLLDCQVASKHLNSMGAEEISRENFLKILKKGKTDLMQPGSPL